jgi:Ca2+-binding RTX toxin-like protein
VKGTKKKVVLQGADGGKIVFKGDFVVEDGTVTGGTITGLKGYAGGTKFMIGTGYDLDFQSFAEALEDDEAAIALLFTVDRAIGSRKDDVMLAVAKTLKGGDGDDTIFGNFRDKTIKGGDGNDLVFAGSGNDQLFGGKGRDTFLFGTIEDGVDRIRDFEGKKDKIAFAPSEDFGALGDSVDAAELVIGTAATTPAHRIVYDDATGRLYWDADGVGGAAQVLLARIDGAPKLKLANFMVEDFFN